MPSEIGSDNKFAFNDDLSVLPSMPIKFTMRKGSEKYDGGMAGGSFSVLAVTVAPPVANDSARDSGTRNISRKPALTQTRRATELCNMKQTNQVNNDGALQHAEEGQGSPRGHF